MTNRGRARRPAAGRRHGMAGWTVAARVVAAWIIVAAGPAAAGAEPARGEEPASPAAATPAASPAAPPAAVPALLGAATPEQILGITPEWKTNHDTYAPDAAAVATIRDAASREKGDLSIEVIFGSWCSDSRRQVPPFIKVMEQLDKAVPLVSYTGVHKDRKDRDPRLAVYQLTAIPTFIVYRKGAEIGRIVETPKETIEADLAAILSKSAAP